MKDTESALREGDVHDVRGADADGSARFRQNDEIISVNRTLVLDRVSLYLKGEEINIQYETWFQRYSTLFLQIRLHILDLKQVFCIMCLLCHLILWDKFTFPHSSAVIFTSSSKFHLRLLLSTRSIRGSHTA